nr:hypothetical protein [Tanacetum cinerariifolium]
MMLRLVRNPSPNQPFIFDIDGRTVEIGSEDLCLITGFWFDKLNLNPKEEDPSEFRKRVFTKIGNLKGEHLLALVNKDVKFNKLDDEDVVLIRSTTRGSSNSKSVYTRVRTEVRHGVHVQAEVSRVVDKEE